MPVVVMGVGAAGVAVGLVSGIAANAKHGSLLAHCSPDGACPMTERDDISAFHTLRTVSTVAYVIGGAALAGGAVWWFLAPASHPDPAAARLWIGPGSAGIGGTLPMSPGRAVGLLSSSPRSPWAALRSSSTRRIAPWKGTPAR